MSDADTSSKTVLFTDMRHIMIGNLKWQTPDGETLPVAGPPEPARDVYADQDLIPRGIRFVAQPATKMYDAEITGPKGRRVICDGGTYRSWSLRAEYPKDRDFGSYSRDTPTSVNVIYSESSDAFEWVEKGRCPVELPGQTGIDGPTYLIDPKAPADERYKFVYCAVAPQDEVDALRAGHAKLDPRHQDWRMLHGKGWDSVQKAAHGSWIWWQAGRLCAIQADLDGEFHTLPMRPAGRELRLNVCTRCAGEVRVGILGVKGRAADDCAPISGDSLAAPVHWGTESDIGMEDGQPVVLRFKLRNASLFGFEWV